MGCEPRRLSSTGPRCGATSQQRAGGKFVSSTLLATIALFAASTVSAHAQTDWTGRLTPDWFVTGNWDAGVPLVVTTATIDTVNPGSDRDCEPGRSSPKSLRRPSRDGDAYNPDRRDIDQFNRNCWFFAGLEWHGDGDGSGLHLVESRISRGRRCGHGHAYHR